MLRVATRGSNWRGFERVTLNPCQMRQSLARMISFGARVPLGKLNARRNPTTTTITATTMSENDTTMPEAARSPADNDEPTVTDAMPTETNAVATTTENGAEETAVATTDGKKMIKKKKRRPARAQVDPETFKGGEIPEQTGTVFNIWYNKWSGGDREDKYISKAHASGRCNIAKDSGYTKADKIPGSYFCLFFARGLCPRGADCEYLHRLPTVHDLFNPNVDAFGRDKFSDYRDDMGGVGSFMRQNHTLYVGRIHVSDDIEEVVARHFAEWGQVERSMFHIPSPFHYYTIYPHDAGTDY